VVLYEHDRSRFFRLVGLFCAGQGLFWAYLAHFAFTALRPPPVTEPGTETAPGSDDPLRPRDNKWRYGFTASCLTVGSLTLAAGWLLPQRSVRRLTLLRGGAAVA
ncbi:TM223 protein, partial [Prunella fulvescens]|nr:TM223 protein [Prunella fulvescens]